MSGPCAMAQSRRLMAAGATFSARKGPGLRGRWSQFPEGCNDPSENLKRIIGPQVAEAEAPASSSPPSPAPKTTISWLNR